MTCYNCEDCPFTNPNIPSNLHEIHLTVNRPDDINAFKEFCTSINIKPVVLDLDSTLDVMTTSRVIGSKEDVFDHIVRLKVLLIAESYEVIRTKVETTLTNPIAKQTSGKDYYESHFAIKVVDNFTITKLHELSWGRALHVSKNLFKNDVIMATYRSFMCDLDDHVRNVSEIYENLKNNFEVIKVINEFCWYDSNLAHDNEWINYNE